jgi:hypothetical protein
MSDVSVVICARTLHRWNELKRAVGSVRTQTHARAHLVAIAATQQAPRKDQQP